MGTIQRDLTTEETTLILNHHLRGPGVAIGLPTSPEIRLYKPFGGLAILKVLQYSLKTRMAGIFNFIMKKVPLLNTIAVHLEPLGSINKRNLCSSSFYNLRNMWKWPGRYSTSSRCKTLFLQRLRTCPRHSNHLLTRTAILYMYNQ